MILMEKALYKVLWYFNQFSQSDKFQSFESGVSDVTPANLQNIYLWCSLHIWCAARFGTICTI